MDVVEQHRLKNRVAASFGAKVAHYAEHAVVQRQLLEKVCRMILKHSHESGSRWVDLGCGDGTLHRLLADASFKGTLIGLDLAAESLNYCRRHAPHSAAGWLQADIDHLPFKPASFRGIVSASALQWSHQPETTLREILQLLKTDGLFVFSMFIDGSFQELIEMRRSFNLPSMVQLPQADAINRYLRAGGCDMIEIDEYRETIYFSSSRGLLRHLNAIGSTGGNSHMSRSTLERFCREFDERFRSGRGVPLTHAAILGTAKKGGSHG